MEVVGGIGHVPNHERTRGRVFSHNVAEDQPQRIDGGYTLEQLRAHDTIAILFERLPVASADIIETVARHFFRHAVGALRPEKGRDNAERGSQRPQRLARSAVESRRWGRSLAP